MKVYLKVTADKYELPIAIADTQAELARMLGMPKSNINSSFSKLRSGKVKASSYVEVEIGDIDAD